MALDPGDVLYGLSETLADWPPGGGGRASTGWRARVGRWPFRAFLAIAAVTAIAMLATWLQSGSFAAFDQARLPVLSLTVLALLVLFAVHVVAAVIANAIDRQRVSRPSGPPPVIEPSGK